MKTVNHANGSTIIIILWALNNNIRIIIYYSLTKLFHLNNLHSTVNYNSNNSLENDRICFNFTNRRNERNHKKIILYVLYVT